MGAVGFGSLTGQNAIKQFLLGSLKSGRISHAYIFEGPRGIGKRSMAAAFAASLVCEGGKGEACGVCRSCVLCRSGSHPDITTLSCAPDKRSIGVDDVRRLIGEAYLKPYYGARKVFIVEDADSMTEQAQNALLKIFEEPPLYAVFILLAQSSRLLLDTINSRGLRLTFSPYATGEVKAVLESRVPSMRDRFDFLAAYSQNVIGRALQLALDEEFTAMRDSVARLLPEMFKGDGTAACLLLQQFEKYKDGSDRLFEIVISLLRDILFLSLGCADLTVNTDLLPRLAPVARSLTPRDAAAALERAMEANERVSRNVNYNLAVMAWLCGSWEDINGRDSGSKV